MANDLVALLIDVAEGLCVRLVETFVWADMLHAECLGHGWQTLELDDGAVFAHRFNLFAILDVDVCRLVLLVVFDGEAVAGRRTLATESLHLGADDVDAQRAKGGKHLL